MRPLPCSLPLLAGATSLFAMACEPSQPPATPGDAPATSSAATSDEEDSPGSSTPAAGDDATSEADARARQACAGDHAALDPSSPEHTAPALANAARCFRQAGGAGLEIRAYRLLVESFPTAPEAKDALRNLGEAYERIGHVADAARFYEKYARRHGAESDAADKLARAVCMRMSFGDRSAADENLRQLNELRSEPTTVAELCPGKDAPTDR